MAAALVPRGRWATGRGVVRLPVRGGGVVLSGWAGSVLGRLFARIAGFGPLDQRSAAGRRFRLPLRPRVGALQGPFRQRRSRCRDRRRRARYVVAYGCCRGAVGAEECGVEVGPEEPTRTVTRVTSRLTNQGVFRSGGCRAGC